MTPKICLVLTEDTIEKNLVLVQKYRSLIDIAELRADFLQPQEVLLIRRFPELAGIPVILTVRRRIDGGRFTAGEATRVTIFARGLAFSDPDPAKNFSYIDLEGDLQAPSIEEAARAFNITIIRSKYNHKKAITDIDAEIQQVRRSDDEIVKIAYKANSLSDVTNLFRFANHERGRCILVAMGAYGVPSRLLAGRLNSEITYVMPQEKTSEFIPGLIDPFSLVYLYRFKQINEKTKIFGVVGSDVSESLGPQMHNKAYAKQNINAVYIPINARVSEDVIEFAEVAGVSGLSIDHPFKKPIVSSMNECSKTTTAIRAANTAVYSNGSWKAFNTDVESFSKALQEFLQVKNLRFNRVAIIGAGGAAQAVAYAVKQLHGKACIFNRTVEKAKQIALPYRFKWAILAPASVKLLEKYSSIIIQTTTVGNSFSLAEDPLFFYTFTGKEAVFDLNYKPEKTALLTHAEEAGCKITNGYRMLEYQTYRQFKIFTGEDYESSLNA
ncbi:type I 3-dehydroquinate dehydratase [Treponema phagedenis]|uniref:type I 3-dehydroquinate dehydratase n=1 Tax=Treponema phagedenis TaxID=162 RepID=UPI0001F63E9C|nr:type I 3-dehydroquinate dehydratase [Treponema phagedenis]EFW37878.1 putative shikimate dehydrogenase [Treponema phagedenis F0421]TYT78621.1 type I 3-dehydroquinate dehydratase [Treponema phagedenis]